MRHVIYRHRYKILVGFPIVALLATTIGFSRAGEHMAFVASERFIEVGATTTIDVRIRSGVAINAVGGVIVVPPEIRVVSVSTNGSVLDLWTEEPRAPLNTSTISFSGGTVRQGGYTGTGLLFSFTVEARAPGVAELIIENPQILAHDGLGTSVFENTIPLSLIIREKGAPSPDVTQSDRVTIADIGIMTRRLFAPYDPRFDFNQDGRITIADLFLLVRHLTY